MPRNEILWTVGLALTLRVTVQVGQRRQRDTVALVSQLLTKRFQHGVRAPLGQLLAADLREQLAHRLAQSQRQAEIKSPLGLAR